MLRIWCMLQGLTVLTICWVSDTGSHIAMPGTSVQDTLLYFKLYCTLNKLGLSWAKLKFSLLRVVNEVTDFLNSVEIKIKVAVELSLLLLRGEGGGLLEKKERN